MSPEDVVLPGVNIADLLSPIAPTAPAGADLRKQPRSIYVELENLLDGTGVPAMISVDAEGRPCTARDLNALSRSISDGLKRALICLAQESKDLDIAALCVRGLLNVHGYSGLYCGLYIVRALHERFWNTLYPNPPSKVQTHDEFDEPLPEPLPEPAHLSERRVLTARSGSIDKLEHAARSALRLVPLFVADDGTVCRIADWDSAMDPDAERSVDELNALANMQGIEVYEELEQVLIACTDECGQLEAMLRQCYKRPALEALGLQEFEPPQLGSLSGQLQSCHRFVMQLRDQVGKKHTPSAKPKNITPDVVTGFTSPAVIASGQYQPKDRAEAIGMMLAAGQFLQRHEPLSPLPRLLFRLVHWSRGDSLRPWLEDMFRDVESEQEQVLQRLALDAENKLGGERLPTNCPVPKDRADALALLSDVMAKLRDYEPLSPISYHLEQLLVLAKGGSPHPWLSQVFTAESPTLLRIRRVLGLSQSAPESKSLES